MAHIITRRDALRLTVGGTAALALGRRGRGADPARRRRRAQVADREGRQACASCGRRASSSRTRCCSAPTPPSSSRRPASRRASTSWAGRTCASSPPSPPTPGTGPDIIIGWSEDPHIYADKIIELSDLAEYLGKRYGGWTFLAEKYGKKDKTNNWLAIPFGGGTGPICYRKSAVKEAGFDGIPNDHADLPEAAAGAEEEQQAGGLRARQRGRRRQRLRQLADLVVRRLSRRRGRQGRDQQQGDDRGAEVPEGPLSDLRAGHAVLGRSEQQPRLCGKRMLAHRQRRLALLRPEERSGHAGDRRGHRACAAALRRRRQAAAGLADPQRHGVQAHQVPERRQGLHPLHDGGRAVRSVAHRLPRLLVAYAQGLQQERGVEVRSEAGAVPGRHREPVLVGLQGADHAMPPARSRRSTSWCRCAPPWPRARRRRRRRPRRRSAATRRYYRGSIATCGRGTVVPGRAL